MWARWRHKVAYLFRRRRFDRELAEELELHRALIEADHAQDGLSADAAARASRRQLGNLTRASEDSRDPWMFRRVESVGRDVRLAWRSLRRQPGFSLVAVATLALGLGGNMAIFRLIDAVVLESLPVPRPQELVHVSMVHSYPFFRELSAATTDLFAGTAAWTTDAPNVTIDGTTENLRAELVSGDYFAMLGVRPAAGRLLNAADDGTPGAHPVCVINYGLWQRRFGGRPDVIGRMIEVNTHRLEIVGVTEERFEGAMLHSRYDLQVPLSMTEIFRGSERDSADMRWLSVIARLAPGVSRVQAESAIQSRFNADNYPKEIPDHALTLADAPQGMAWLKNRLADELLIAQALSACVLLMACANLANLLLARTSARRHEIAVRKSLGASRHGLVAQLVVESLLLSTIGAAVGVVLAALLDRVVGPMLLHPAWNVHLGELPSTRGLAAAGGAVLLTALAIGLVPAIVATGELPLEGLRESPRTASRSNWIGGFLVVVQVAVCLVLVFGAGLFARSLGGLRAIDVGFHPSRVVLISVEPGGSGFSPARLQEFAAEWLRRARLVPEVTSTSLATVTVLSGSMYAGSVTVPDAEPRRGDEPNNNFNTVTSDYFRTIGVPLVAGRTFTEADTWQAPKVAIVNERFVEYYWPGQSPIGRHIRALDDDLEIVGLVGTTKYQALLEEPQITIYFPLTQRRPASLTMHARVDGSMGRATAALAQLVGEIDPSVPVSDVSTLQNQIDGQIGNERVLNLLGVLFGLLALVVAAAGLYGLVAYAATRRAREVGIRIAIGARPRDIVRLFVRNILVLVGVGVALGGPAALIAGRQFSAVLYGVAPFHTPTLVTAAVVLVGVAVVAASLPAIRAAAADPVAALKTE